MAAMDPVASVGPMTDESFASMQREIAALGEGGTRKDRATWSDWIVASLVARCAAEAKAADEWLAKGLAAFNKLPDDMRIGELQDAYREIQAKLARALPAPRRYTGEPLADGLYLWRAAWWRPGYWQRLLVEGGQPDSLDTTPYDPRRAAERDPLPLIIGPIQIPEPESAEAA